MLNSFILSVVKSSQSLRRSGLLSPTTRIQLSTANAAMLQAGRGIAKSLSMVFEPRWGVAIVVMLAILSPQPKEDAAILASSPPLECAMMLTFSLPVRASISSMRPAIASALVSMLAQQS